MTDKKVGEVWKKLNDDCKAKDECLNHGDMFQLIRKLVEETAFHGDRSPFTDCEQEIYLRDALRTYGIDPITWE